MKQIIRLFITLAAAASAACQTDTADDKHAAAADHVRFSSEEIAHTRTVVGKEEGTLTVNWVSGDLIGIYGAAENRSLGSNYPYEARVTDEEGGGCTFRYLNPGQTFQNPARGNLFYAYYPYDADAGTTAGSVALSLPEEQYQSAAGTTENPAKLGFMKAVPTAVTDPEAIVNFEFHNVFAIVELQLSLNAASTMNSVPIRSIRMTSSSSDLIAPQAEIDLTTPVEGGYSVLPVTVLEGGRSANLTFDATASLTKQPGSFYFVLLPGSHPSGSITLEVTAIDNSVNTVTLSGDVEFRSNRHYTKSVELALEEFRQKEPFAVTPAALSVKAGESLRFDFSGKASGIVFWSGEEGHDYEKSEIGDIIEASVFLSFGSLYVNGCQRNCGSVKYSTDFNGTYDEASVKAATWTDVSSQFMLPPWISGSSAANVTDPEANAYGTPYDSGTVDITSWFRDYETPVYFAFFYHLEKSDANFVDEKTGKPNNRTMWDLYYCQVSKSYPGDSSPTRFFYFDGPEQSSVELVMPASWNASYPCVKNVTAAGKKVIRMTEANKPSGSRDAYCITHAIYRPEAQILPADSGVTVPSGNSYGYVFTTPGVYRVAFVATIPTLAGDAKAVERFEITVTE